MRVWWFQPLQQRLFLVLASLLVVSFTSHTPEPSTASDAEDIPAWVLEGMDRAIGRWEADNTAYQTDDEPFDAYGIEWAWSIGEKSLTGRLFGLQDGEEQGTFWEFRQFWHPGTQQLMAYQFGGDGTVGIGTIESVGTDSTHLLQTFYRPDGTTFRIGHRSAMKGDEDHTQSYDVDANGVWTERRFYVWRRVE